MRAKRILSLLFALLLPVLLTGCRTRISGGEGSPASEAASGAPAEALPGSLSAPEADSPEETESPEAGAGGKTKENPLASRKEYDENAAAEILPATDRLLHTAGEGTGAPTASEALDERARQTRPEAEETATQTAAAPEAEQMGVSEDAEAADSALTYFTVLLQDRLGALFECQRLDAYWETARDHVTIHKSAPEHALLLNAGCYDVSARLLPENLLVDDGWVARKNPGVIVKIVEGGVLGSGTESAAAAAALCRQLISRPGWAALDAVKNRRVLLLSQELLEAPHLQIAAMLMIAKTANPALFSDVEGEEALRMLAEEAGGTIPSGRYFYVQED